MGGMERARRMVVRERVRMRMGVGVGISEEVGGGGGEDGTDCWEVFLILYSHTESLLGLNSIGIC